MAKKENKEKRISVNKLEGSRRNDIIQIPFSTEDGNVIVTVYKVLPLPKMLEFVETVVSSVVDLDDGSYLPEIKDMMVRKMVLTLYANFTMPQKAEKQYDLLYNTGAYDLVINNIDLFAFEEIVHAIDRKIAHRLDVMNNTAYTQMRELIGKVDEAIGTFESAFESVNVDELASFVRNISKVENIDETKVVDAIMRNDNQSDYEERQDQEQERPPFILLDGADAEDSE